MHYLWRVENVPMYECSVPCGEDSMVVRGSVTHLILCIHHTTLQQYQDVTEKGLTLSTKLCKH